MDERELEILNSTWGVFYGRSLAKPALKLSPG